jgi:hypothetical protein
MGLWSDWYSKNAGKEKSLVNAEWVLKKLDDVSGNILKQIYPVGSIFMSINNVNPSTWITGTTWAVWGSGRVPVGVDTSQNEFNTVEKTGGEKNHTLTIDEIPSHDHSITDPGHSHSLSGSNLDKEGRAVLWTDPVDMNQGSVSVSTTGISINNTGEGKSHNNIQPYITCYMFKRTG